MAVADSRRVSAGMCGRDCLNRVIRVFTLALLPVVGSGATFNGVSYVDSGDIVLGQWNGQFTKAKSYAAAKNLPLVVVWVNPGCGFCTSFEKNVMANANVISWMKSRKYVFVMAINKVTSDASAAFSFVGGGYYPRARVAVPNGGASSKFTARMTASAFVEKVDGVTGQSGSGDGSGSGTDGGSGSSSGSSSGTTTVKTYQLSLTASPTAGGALSGAGKYASGKTVTVSAKAASGYVFAGWYSGSTLKSQATSYKVTMGSAASALTGKFILTSADKVTKLTCPLKSGYARGTKIADVAVSVTATSLPTVKATGLPTGLSYSSSTGKISGTPTKSGVFSSVVAAKTAGGAQKALTNEVVVRATGEYVLRIAGDAASVKTSGAGVYAAEKRVTLRATTAKGKVFLGWYDGTKRLSETKSCSYAMPASDKTLTAKTTTSEADAQAVTATVGGLSFGSKVTTRATNLVCGVAVSWPVAAEGLTTTSASVSGLPAGLSYSAKTGLVTGVPTKAQTKAVKIVAKTAGGTQVTYRLDVTVQSLPVWASGTFNGGGEDGLLTLTVGSSGKVSGKYLSSGTNWTLSATSYANYDARKEALRVDVLAKYGKRVQTNQVQVTGSVAALLGEATCKRFTGWWNGWKHADLKDSAKRIDAATNITYWVDAPVPGAVTLSFGASGKVTAKGVFVIGQNARTGKDVTYSVSCSTSLCRRDDRDGLVAYVYFPPKKNTFDGFVDCPELGFDGTNVFFDK